MLDDQTDETILAAVILSCRTHAQYRVFQRLWLAPRHRRAYVASALYQPLQTVR